MLRDELIHRAIDGQRESRNLDSKTGFDITSTEEWCEIIKDIVAFANSGGGAILVGADNNGSFAGTDIQPYLDIDPADLTNKLRAYTGQDFSDFEITEIQKGRHNFALFVIYPASIPMVFIRDGAHVETSKGRRPAFVKGSVYFRHGAKSEPGTSDDFRLWLDRSLESIRESWLGGIR